MRSLPAAITNALAGSGQLPYFLVTIQDLTNRYTQLASGGTTGHCSALVTSAGTLLKAITPQNTDPNPVIIQRITSPSTAREWTAAGSQITTNAQANAGTALAQTGSTIRCFYQRTADHLICYRDSSDDGQTWGAEQVTVSTQPNAGNAPFCFGIAATSTTSVLVAAAVSATAAAWLTRSTYTTAWSGWSHDTPPLGEGPASPPTQYLHGIQAITQSGTDIIAAGLATQIPATGGITTGIGAWLTTYAAGSYSPWSPVQQLDNPNLGLTTARPTIHYDPSAALYYLTAHLQNDGSVSGQSSTRTRVYSSPDRATWTPMLELAQLFQFGAHTLTLSGSLYVFDAASTVIALSTPAPQDISLDVLSLTITSQLNREAHCALTLDNSSGQYTTAPSLRTDARVTVGLGYGTTAVTVGTYIIDSYTLEDSSTKLQIVLQCRDYLKLLDYPSNRLLVYSGQTIAQLITAICGTAGLAVGTLPGTAQFGYTVPCFMVSQGETYLNALERLSTIYGFRFWCDETPQLRVAEPAAGDASTWTYGWEALSISQSHSADQASVVRVTGIDASANSVYGEAIDQAAIELVGRERYRHVVDRAIDTAAKANARAALELRDEQMAAYTAGLLVAVNPGHELCDVITFSDPNEGSTNQTARITQSTTTVHPEQGVYDQLLHCTGV